MIYDHPDHLTKEQVLGALSTDSINEASAARNKKTLEMLAVDKGWVEPSKTTYFKDYKRNAG